MTDIAPQITVSYGDGIGSEIMEATLVILREAGANISIETLEVGERIYNMGARYGILPSAWEILGRNKILLKSPVIIPHNPDYEYKNLNEIIYKKFELSEENIVISNIIPEEYYADFLAGSASIGESFALFESVHDSAPEIAGRNIANPTGVIQAAIMMLEHIGQTEVAERIKKALLSTIEEGIHTADMYKKGRSKQKAGTKEFTEAVTQRLFIK